MQCPETAFTSRLSPIFFFRGCDFGKADEDLELVLADLRKWYRCEWTHLMPIHHVLRGSVNLPVIEHRDIGLDFLR